MVNVGKYIPVWFGAFGKISRYLNRIKRLHPPPPFSGHKIVRTLGLMAAVAWQKTSCWFDEFIDSYGWGCFFAGSDRNLIVIVSWRLFYWYLRGRNKNQPTCKINWQHRLKLRNKSDPWIWLYAIQLNCWGSLARWRVGEWTLSQFSETSHTARFDLYKSFWVSAKLVIMRSLVDRFLTSFLSKQTTYTTLG